VEFGYLEPVSFDSLLFYSFFFALIIHLTKIIRSGPAGKSFIAIAIALALPFCFLIVIYQSVVKKYIIEKSENFKEMLERVGSTSPILLIIITVIFIGFFILIPANIELSTNTDGYNNVYLNMKNGLIILSFGKTNFSFGLLSSKNLSFNNSTIKKCFNSSALLRSDLENPIPTISGTTEELTEPRNERSPDLEALIRQAAQNLENERVSRLKLIKYQEGPVEEEEKDYMPPMEEYAESFPWFVDEDGRPIDFNKSIKLFNGVKLVSNFLTTRLNADPELVSKIKITELLELFKDNDKVTVLELYQHVSQKFREDETSFSEKLTTETEKLSDNLLTDESNTYKPFGSRGDITLNQIGVALKENIKDINWEFIYNQTKLTIHGIPVAVNAIGYGLLIKTSMKYVHNRPLESGLSLKQREYRLLMRNRQLGIFCILGAPLTAYLLKSSAIPMKEMFNLTIGGESHGGSNNSNLNNSTLFLFFSNLNKKIPRYIKIFFRFLFLSLLVLNLLGFSFFSLILIKTYTYIWNLVFYIGCPLVISYQLLSLYLLHKFTKKKIKIPQVLPEFLIN
jgi:hypothetical protein